jgi:serine protease Do
MVVRGFLGITINNLDQDSAEAFGLSSRDGALVAEVAPGRAADKGGVRHGDIVVAIDGEPIEDTRELIDTISAMPPGTEVELTVIRDGKQRILEIELEARDAIGEETSRDVEPSQDGDTDERLGISVSELSLQVRRMYGLEDEAEGVVITRVLPVSPAADENLIRGDLIIEANGETIETVDQLREIVTAVPQGGYLRLYVQRPQAGGRSFFAILKLQD